MRRLAQPTYQLVFGIGYLVLGTNLLIVITALPFWIVLLTTDPARSWPVLALSGALLAPAVMGAFAVFSAHSTDGSLAVTRTFLAAWWRGLRRTLTVGVLASGSICVLALDIATLWGQRIGALAIPMLATGLVTTASIAQMALALLAEDPQLHLGTVMRASLWLTVRRWYLSLLSLVILTALYAVLVQRPALALGALATPVLYLVWANARRTLRPVLDTDRDPAATPTRIRL